MLIQWAPSLIEKYMSGKERRNFQRMAVGDTPVQVWTEQHSWNGCIKNQSLGGIGLLLDSETSLATGDELRLQYDDSEAIGFVRYVRNKDDNTCFIGVAWDQREEPRKTRKTEAVFLVSGPLDVVCQSRVQYNDDESATFKLWDGAEFTESARQLRTFSPSDREQTLLADAEYLNTLLQLYGLGPTDSTDVAVERVVDFEFTR